MLNAGCVEKGGIQITYMDMRIRLKLSFQRLEKTAQANPARICPSPLPSQCLRAKSHICKGFPVNSPLSPAPQPQRGNKELDVGWFLFVFGLFFDVLKILVNVHVPFGPIGGFASPIEIANGISPRHNNFRAG